MLRLFPYSLLFALWLGVPDYLLAQHLSFKYLGAEKGMNSLGSYHAIFDQFGFIWVPTGDGLLRYNGTEVTYYYQHTHPELSSDQIGHLLCDSQNRMWVCTRNGLTQIDKDRMLHRQVIVETKPKLGVVACMEDGEGRIYAITEEGIFSSTSDGHPWKPEPILDSLFQKNRFSQLSRFDQDRYLVVFQGTGVMLLNVSNKKMESFIPLKDANRTTRFDHNSILICTGSTFDCYHASLTDSTIITRLPPPPGFTLKNLHEQVLYLVRAQDGNVYMATAGEGLLSLDSTLTRYHQYKHDPVNPSTITSNSLRYIETDSSGHLLITSFDGVNYTNVFAGAIEYINYIKDDEGRLIDNRVISVSEDWQHRIWICMLEMVYIYDPETKISKPVTIPANIKLKSDRLAPIYIEQDRQGKMWIALKHEGIGIFNEAGICKKIISPLEENSWWSAVKNSRVMKEGFDGYMYVGTEKGFFRIHVESWKVDTFPEDPPLQELRDERIVDILPLKDGIWVTSSPRGAAWHYDWNTKKLKKYDHQNGMLTNRLYSLSNDSLGNIFIGSFAGFTQIDTHDSILNLVKGDGLISPRIESVETADDGSVWMANNYNLLKYIPKTGEIFRLGARQGLPAVSFTIMGSTKMASGKLVFGANKGILIVDPATIDFDQDSIDLFVFYRSPDGKEVDLNHHEPLSFNYKQYFLQFAVAVNDIMMGDKILYRYRLSSKNEGTWSKPSTNNTINFELSPGQYQLEVQAYNGNKWFSFQSPILFRIHPPWWRQTWFILMALAVIIGLVYYFIRSKIEKYQKELAIAKEITELESKALRAQMNPHFVFNCLNAIQECIVTGKVDEAYAYLSKFSKLLRLVLDHSDRSMVTLQEELEVLSLYLSLEKLRFRDNMEYIVHVEEELDQEEIQIPPMLIQPDLENAVWHGLRHKEGEKKLFMSFQEQVPGYLTVIIEDNGIGRVRSREIRASKLGNSKHTSKGKQLSGNRIELLRKNYPETTMTTTDLYDDSGIATGTRVELMIPIVHDVS